MLLRRQAPKGNSAAPPQMKANETPRSGVNASPCITPITKVMLGR